MMKKSVIISCGGGVVGDVSALASSLYLRGLIYFHIPTTMTAIVDSCIGGKTAINYKPFDEIIKNMLKEKPELVKKFMRAATRSFEEATKNPEAAVDAMLKANAKAGLIVKRFIKRSGIKF